MIVSNVVFAVMLIAMFFVLWPCIRFAIENSPLHQVNWVLAPAASVLCILAMLRTGEDAEAKSLLYVVLVPWAALGASLLLVVILLVLRRLGLLPSGNSDKRGDDTRKQGEHHSYGESGRTRKSDGELHKRIARMGDRGYNQE